MKPIIKQNRNTTPSIKEYLDEIKPYLRDIIVNLKKSGTWKTQFTIAINFSSSKDSDEECVMHLNSNNIEIMIHDELIK